MNHKMLAGALLAGIVVLGYKWAEDDLAPGEPSAGPAAGMDLPRRADLPRGVAEAGARSDVPQPVVEPPLPAAAPIAAATPAVRLDGRWYGEIRAGPDDEHLQFSFDFRTAGDTLTGRANFPIGEGRITNGRVHGNRLSFTTAHALPATGQVLLSHFEGEATEREIVLDVTSGEGGRSRLTVIRIGS